MQTTGLLTTDTDPQIAFNDFGSGDPALLMLPGWCSNRTIFAGLLEPAARHRRALALDWRGHGASAQPDGDYGTTDLVADALAVIDHGGVETVVP